MIKVSENLKEVNFFQEIAESGVIKIVITIQLDLEIVKQHNMKPCRSSLSS